MPPSFSAQVSPFARPANRTLSTRPARIGHVQVYGAVMRCRETGRYCLVQGQRTGKWSFPKGHIKENETPLECVARETAEETGVDALPTPLHEVRLRAGVYYYFDTPTEFELVPRDTHEIGVAGWYSLEDMQRMNLNIDANTYLAQQLRRTVRTSLVTRASPMFSASPVIFASPSSFAL
jgi:bis(5'-nucleosidyl)-tetraphosphatase